MMGSDRRDAMWNRPRHTLSVDAPAFTPQQVTPQPPQQQREVRCRGCRRTFRTSSANNGQVMQRGDGDSRSYASWDAAVAAHAQHEKQCLLQMKLFQKPQRADAGDRKAAVATAVAELGQERLRGTVRGCDTGKRRFTFIACSAFRKACGRDVQVHEKDSGRFAVGSTVSFTVELSRAGAPVAVDLVADPVYREPFVPPPATPPAPTALLVPVAPVPDHVPPSVLCPHDSMCALINDPHHQVEFLHTCKIPDCPNRYQPWHTRYFVHDGEAEWIGGAQSVHSAGSTPPQPALSFSAPCWGQAEVPPVTVDAGGRYVGRVEWTEGADVPIRCDVVRERYGADPVVGQEVVGNYPDHARVSFAVTVGADGVPRAHELELDTGSSPRGTVPKRQFKHPGHLPVCPNDTSCRSINESAHQAHYRHTCKIRPCTLIEADWHSAYFLHTAENLSAEPTQGELAQLAADAAALGGGSPAPDGSSTDSPPPNACEKRKSFRTPPKHGGFPTITVSDLMLTEARQRPAGGGAAAAAAASAAVLACAADRPEPEVAEPAPAAAAAREEEEEDGDGLAGSSPPPPPQQQPQPLRPAPAQGQRQCDDGGSPGDSGGAAAAPRTAPSPSTTLYSGTARLRRKLAGNTPPALEPSASPQPPAPPQPQPAPPQPAPPSTSSPTPKQQPQPAPARGPEPRGGGRAADAEARRLWVAAAVFVLSLLALDPFGTLGPVARGIVSVFAAGVVASGVAGLGPLGQMLQPAAPVYHVPALLSPHTQHVDWPTPRSGRGKGTLTPTSVHRATPNSRASASGSRRGRSLSAELLGTPAVHVGPGVRGTSATSSPFRRPSLTTPLQQPVAEGAFRDNGSSTPPTLLDNQSHCSGTPEGTPVHGASVVSPLHR